jgi:hypothetical protein
VPVVSAAGALILAVLPGCWLTFFGPARALPVAGRFSLAMLLSPVVVTAEWYLLRLAGLPFPVTAVLLPLVNLPAGLALWPALRPVRRLLPGTLLAIAAMALPLAYLWYWMHDPLVRANWGHAWTHADMVYMLANGPLRPEEPYLAGVGLAYPWTSHVNVAVVSWLVKAPPNVVYLLVNIAVLVGAAGAIAALTAELGGGRLARVISVHGLGFGINLAGAAWWLLPAETLARYPAVWGDGRFTPWLRKFGVFEPTVIGIGLCVAVLYVLCRPSEGRTTWSTAMLGGLLVLTLGTFYPILLPAAVGIVGARVVASALVPLVAARIRRESDPAFFMRIRETGRLVLTVVIAVAISILFLRIVTESRAPGAPLGPSTLYEVKVKAVTIVLVLAPLALGVLFAARQAVRIPVESVTLLGAAASCAMLYVVFHVYFDRNEYKYVFPAAASLVPLASLGFARVPQWWKYGGRVVLVVAAVVTAFPGFYRRYTEIRGADSPPVRVAWSGFEFGLASTERYAEVLRVVRRESPPTAILLARRGDIDLVALTGRALWVPPDTGVVFGMGLKADHLLKRVRGYPAPLIDERRRLLFTILDSGETAGARALDELLGGTRRPAVLVADSADAGLRAWLPSRPDARLIFDRDGLQAWLVSSTAQPQRSVK